MTFETFEVDLDAVLQIDADRIGIQRGRTLDGAPFRFADLQAAMTNLLDLFGVLNNSFGDQETGGELRISTRRPHRDRDRTMTFPRDSEPYLKRLLDGQDVWRVFRDGSGDHAPDGCSLCGAHDCSLAKRGDLP